MKIFRAQGVSKALTGAGMGQVERRQVDCAGRGERREERRRRRGEERGEERGGDGEWSRGDESRVEDWSGKDWKGV